MREIQEMFNLIPNLSDAELTKSFMIKTNDNMVALYLASLIRSITAMHDLINNKLEFRAAEGLSLEKEKPKETASKDEKKDAVKKGKEEPTEKSS